MDLCCFCPQSRRPRPRLLARREAFRHNAVVDWIDDRDRICRVGPGTPCGRLLRQYWQPIALVEELDSDRPLKAVRLLGEGYLLFGDEAGR